MSQYILNSTPGGKPTLVYRGPRDVRLHSAYEPDREAERAVEGFSAGRATVIVASGVALGYHLDSLRRKFPGRTIIAVEHDAEVVALARENCPGHLEGVAVVTSATELPGVLERIDMAGFRGMVHYPHRPSYQLYRDFYDGVFRDMGQYMSSKISDLLTRFEFEERWVENILKNVRHIFSSASVAGLFGRFAGVPGVIVSAGPSLRKNARLLGEMRERALIVAVDTAARVLDRLGIEPHIIMTLDAQKYSIKHFLGLRESGAALLADLVSYPAVARVYRGRRILSTTSKYYPDAGGELKRETTPLMDWIEKYVRPIGDIQSGGSVATSAFDLLLNLGCSPIILVGQDLAYTGREIHCSGTYHNDEWLPRVSRLSNLDTINQGVIRKRKIKYVAAYGGSGAVISDFVFDLYRGWFEDSARKVSVPVINASEGGARIVGTEEQSLESVRAGCRALKTSPADLLGRALAGWRPDSPDRLAAAMKRALDDLRQLRDMAEKALDNRGLVPVVEEMVNGEDIRLMIQPFMRKSRTFLARYDKGPEEAERMVLADVRSAAGKLIPAIEESLRGLDPSEGGVS